MSNKSKDKSLRLIFPQWQGGNNPAYFFGAQLLNWLAPPAQGAVEEIEVKKPDLTALEDENGIVGRSVLLNQLKDAIKKIDTHSPDNIVVLGGDCLVDLAPFAYLNQKYENDLAVLWIDAHSDILTPEHFNHGHAMVLGSLLGAGDEEFASFVSHPLKAKNVCYLGVNNASDWEAEQIKKLGLRNISPEELREKGSQTLIEWFKSTGAKHLAIHLDLDVLDPELFRSLLFANVDYSPDLFEGVAKGKLSISEVLNAVNDIAGYSKVVGLGIAEHLPWDALALKKMMEKLPLVGS